MSKPLLATLVVIAALLGALLALFAVSLWPVSNDKLIHDFYLSETTSTVSPTDYLNHLTEGQTDWLVVDLRAPGAYSAGHLVGAINIPAEGMSDAQMVEAFRALPAGKTTINYCYSSYCSLSKKVGLVLSNNGIYAKDMSAGALEILRDYPGDIVNGTAPGDLRSVSGGPQTCSAKGGNLSC